MSHSVDLDLPYGADVELIILASSADKLSSIFGAMQIKLHICADSSAQSKYPKRRRAAGIPALTGSFNADP